MSLFCKIQSRSNESTLNMVKGKGQCEIPKLAQGTFILHAPDRTITQDSTCTEYNTGVWGWGVGNLCTNSNPRTSSLGLHTRPHPRRGLVYRPQNACVWVRVGTYATNHLQNCAHFYLGLFQLKRTARPLVQPITRKRFVRIVENSRKPFVRDGLILRVETTGH